MFLRGKERDFLAAERAANEWGSLCDLGIIKMIDFASASHEGVATELKLFFKERVFRRHLPGN